MEIGHTQMKSQSGIYEIFNTVNGKRYIGSTKNFKDRWRRHLRALRLREHHSTALQRAWDKYGESAFKFLPILTCAPTKEALYFYEQQLFDKVAPEYNIAKDAACSSRGRTLSAETKAKIGEKSRGRHPSAATRALMSQSMRGIPKSPAHCAKIGARTKGTERSLELRARISAKLKGIKRAPFTQEHRDKLAAANIGKKQSPETVAKRAASMVGNTNTLGFKHSDSTKTKMAEAHARRRVAQIRVQ